MINQKLFDIASVPALPLGGNDIQNLSRYQPFAPMWQKTQPSRSLYLASPAEALAKAGVLT